MARTLPKLPSAGAHWYVHPAGQIVQDVVPDGCVRVTCGRHTAVISARALNRLSERPELCGFGGWCTARLRELSERSHTALIRSLDRPTPADIVIRFRGGPL